MVSYREKISFERNLLKFRQGEIFLSSTIICRGEHELYIVKFSNVSKEWTHMRFAPYVINGRFQGKEIDNMLPRLDRMIYRYHGDSIRCYQILNPRPIGYLHDWLPSYLLAGYQTRTDLYARDNETRRPRFRDGYRFVVPMDASSMVLGKCTV